MQAAHPPVADSHRTPRSGHHRATFTRRIVVCRFVVQSERSLSPLDGAHGHSGRFRLCARLYKAGNQECKVPSCSRSQTILYFNRPHVRIILSSKCLPRCMRLRWRTGRTYTRWTQSDASKRAWRDGGTVLRFELLRVTQNINRDWNVYTSDAADECET